MKKFFLLMALVLTAGVVHAQEAYNPNFGSRVKLTEAKRANSRVSGPKTFSWSENNQYYSENGQPVNLFNNVQNSDNIPPGKTMAETYENFVIRVSGLTSDSPYSVEFYDLEYDNGIEKEVLLHTFTYWKDDVHISPLRSLFSEQDINRIHRVKLKSSCSSGRLIFEEAYFISALPALDFTDKDDIDIGNAYIDPSYLIRSNRLWVDINPDRTFTINCAKGTKLGTLSFSLPYKTGIDMSNVTFTATDFIRTADVMNRYIVENKRVDLEHKEGTDDYTGAHKTVRTLYNSRYSGAFYDQLNEDALSGVGGTSDKAIKHVNSIYWQTFDFDTSGDTEDKRSVFCQDICLTKNTIKARKTRKELDPTMWPMHDDEQGFRNKDYPVRPYDNRNTPTNDWSDVVRGDWNADYGNNPRYWNCADFSRYNKMRITGSPNTSLDIRFSTKASVNEISSPDDLKVIVVKTDAHGEVNVDLGNYEHFLLHAILFHDDKNNKLGLSRVIDDIKGDGQGGLRDKLWVDDVELFEGEGREVDLVGTANKNDQNITANMYHVWNNDNNYQWQYGTIVRWVTTSEDGQAKFYQNYEQNLSENGLVWGTIGLYAENYADLTGYKAIRVYAESGTFKFVFNTIWNRSGSDYSRQEKTATVDPAKGYAELDISNYEYVHLNGIKVNWGSSTSGVTAIKLVEDEEADYIFYGNGSYGEQGKAKIDPTVEAATNNPSAKVIDVRARCNNMQEEYDEDLFGSGLAKIEHLSLQKPANPNLLFITRTNQFEGIKVGKTTNSAGYEEDVVENYNLITPSNKDFNTDGSSEYFTANEIRLEDGFSFYAPKQINAAQAKYTRTFKNTIDAVNSIILPFAVEAGNTPVTESKFGFYETTETLKSTTAQNSVVGILNEQTANEGDWLIQFQKKTGTTKANKPYLYAVAANTGTKEFTGAKTGDNVIISATPDVKTKAIVNMTNNESETNTFDYYLRGVYESTYIDDILFYGTDGTLYRTPYMTVTPFRTIFKSPITVIEDDIDTEDDEWKDSQSDYFTPANGVKVVLAFDPHNDSSDINEVIADGFFAEDEPIYNVAGQRVNTFGKGIYIVGGKKILVK